MPEVIVGAPDADPEGISSAGSAYLHSGANGALLHQFNGQAEGDYLGDSVAGVGDVDGDGVPDVIVGAPQFFGTVEAGRAYVYSGADGAVLLQFDGARDHDRLGWSVAGAGDVNSDGHADLIVGSMHGGAHIYSGADGALLYPFEALSWDHLGWSVAGAGDINGDGVPDVIVGAPGAGRREDMGSRGRVYVYSGADGSLIYQFNGDAVGDRFGESVSGAGDVNGDGVPDVIVGAPRALPGGLWDAGSAYVYSGTDGTLLFQFDGTGVREWMGISVAGVGDLTGDVRSEVVVGTDSNSVYVLSMYSRYDVDADCDIDVEDIMAVASNWRCRCGDQCYQTQYDLDGDCDIDIVDIMTVASHWGCECGDECYGTAVSAIRQVEPGPLMAPAAVRLEPGSSMVTASEMFTVAVEIEGAVNLGGFQWVMNFDPAVVHVDSVTLGSFLGSTGRSTVPLGPEIDDDAGTITFGGFSFGSQPGASGDGELAIITLTAQGTGSSPVELKNVKIAETGGQAQTVTVEDGRVMVVSSRRIYLPLVGGE